MKILYTISGMSQQSGGPTSCLINLVNGLCHLGTDVSFLTFDSEDTPQFPKSVRLEKVPSPVEMRYGFSRQFRKSLEKFNHVDLVHTHGLWQYSSHISAGFAQRSRIPFVISPHGMLYPAALKKSTIFKRLAMPIYQRKDLMRASVIHATCHQEMQHVRKLGFRNPIAVIPNSIEIKPEPKRNENISVIKKIGFLGRFSPIKNIENLIYAWALIGKNQPDLQLVLIGDGEKKYTESLKHLAANLGIQNIHFTGFLNGHEKQEVIRTLSFLVLPSKSENFGMVVAEALLLGIPVVASKGTPWEELNTHRAGWWIDMGVDPLVKALEQALSLKDEERIQMGINGRRLVEQNYSVEIVAQKMIRLYDWILKGGEKPDFIYLD